jgi:hypothetical protein
MAYYCKDCSYRGKVSGQAGECPACGSFNIKKTGIKQEKPPPAKWRLIVLAILWGYLIALIIWKLVH